MLNETEFYESRRQILKNDKFIDLKLNFKRVINK